MATFLQLKSRIAQWMDRYDSTEFSDDVRGYCVNRAVDDVVKNSWARWGVFKTDLSITSGTATYALSTLDPNCYDVDTVTVPADEDTPTDYNELRTVLVKVSLSDLISYFPTDNTADADVEAFAINGSNLVLAPTPSGDMTAEVVGRRTMPEMVSDTDHNDVTDEAEDLVFWRALVYAIGFFPGEEERLIVIEREWKRALHRMIVKEARTTQPVRPRLGLML